MINTLSKTITKYEMKYLKYLLLFILLMVSACTTISTFTQEYDTTMQIEYKNYYTQWQLDSICDADYLEHNLNSWYIINLRDDETKENVTQYMFIQSLGENECIYRVQKINDDLYKITKRITK